MKDFEGKIIKVYLNANSGWLVQTGPFIRIEDDFVIMKNKLNGKIQYLSKNYIKYIEIVHDIADENYEDEDDE